MNLRQSKVDSGGTFNYVTDGSSSASPVLNDGAATFTPGISERRSSTSKFYHTDGLSVRGITGSNEATTDTALYDGFGNVVSRTGSTPTPFQFAGALQYQTDEDSDLQLLGNRYYDPSIGRFLSKDPAKDGDNWYAYCENNLVSCADPSGLFWDTVADVIGLVADIVDFVQNPSLSSGAMLLVDAVFTLIPFVPSTGGMRHGPGWIDNAGNWLGDTAYKLGNQFDRVPDLPSGGGEGFSSGPPHFWGADKPWRTGATPDSIYTHLGPDGSAIQNAIYDHSGDVIAQIDFKPHGPAPSGHWHEFPTPGDPSSGHGPGKPHHSPDTVPDGWGVLPSGASPKKPIGSY